MEEFGNFDTNAVVSVLTRGMEFTNELKKQLNSTAGSEQIRDSVLEEILCSYDKALKLLDCMAFLGNDDPLPSPTGFGVANGGVDSHSSEALEQSSLDSSAVKEGSKKRKTLPKWNEQVKVGAGAGFEGQLDDGYNWRKYGQKNILGSNYPRAYYRCTHRNTQGCLATKQVQRADEDPSLIEISYRGRHSCIQERIKQGKENGTKVEIQKQSKKARVEIQPGLKPEPGQELNTTNEEDQVAPFTFPSTPIEYHTMEAQPFPGPGSIVGTSHSSQFLSPATSDSYISLSQCNVNDFGIGQSLPSSESDLCEIISNPNSFFETDIDFEGLNFCMDDGDLNFSMDDLSFRSTLDTFDF